MNRLMLFSGTIRREGWKTMDSNPAHGADFVAKVPPLPEAVRLIQWNEIEWIHGVTSLYPWEAGETLAAIHEALALGGVLTLEQPNAEQCYQAKRPEWLFGDPSLRAPLHMNKWAYTPDSLTKALREAGFSRVEILPAQHHLPARDFRAEAYR